MNFKVLSNSLTLLALYGTLLCRTRAQLVCEYDHSEVLTENGVEVSVQVTYAIKTGDEDGFLKLNFHEGKFAHIPDIKAWCVDLSRPIGAKLYNVDVLSSMDVDVTDIHYTDAVDKPEYLPSVNYLFNHYPSGSIHNITDCVENHMITDQEFQISVWSLVDDVEDANDYWEGETDQCVIDHLVAMGKDNMNYEPDCTSPDEIFGIFVIVDDDWNTYGNITRQTLVAEVPLNETGVCDCKSGGIGAFGDPHFRTWSGEFYDFHGACDLTLIKNPEFENGLGMDIQIRSTKMGFWSYISRAAIRIGEDILEIVGGKTNEEYFINGIPGEKKEDDDASRGMTLTSTLSGYPINYKQLSDKEREFTIELGEGDNIVFTIWNLFVGVHMKNPKEEHFKDSVGLMGSFPQGVKLARDNVSVMDNLNSFGQEWQVLASEPKLFHDIEGPQHPDSCEIPTNSEMRRRLEESTVTMEEATKACAKVKGEVMDLCVFDVMATNDKSSAGAY